MWATARFATPNEEYKDDEDGEESEDDELNLGHDVGVDWTIVLSNTSTEQPSRLDVNSYNECCDSNELHTPLGSDVEDAMERFLAFKQATKFEIVMMFKDKMQINDKKRVVENVWTPRNRQAMTDWLAQKLVNTLRHTPEMKTKGLIAERVEKWGVNLSVDQAYRAKKKEIELIQGVGREQFIHLRSYAEELPLIGLDACFVKGDFRGHLVCAIGKDGNNKMIPIAYTVVEVETKDSWQWFLKLLLEDLQSIQQNTYGFISDQQKFCSISCNVYLKYVCCSSYV
ncbi:uncharacterized protein LOC131630348 [Vicia villosa]|uniref:uncharacterized protein LOC131630348 n=1 Tax=Vicia villosa TaxID=3911 RepID=UPI00273B741E|nr:uncharacterized protein LOC131630348 [Vicia villosa]